MKTIYKYEISPGIESFEMPVGAEVLTVQAQNDKPYLWALVDTTEKAVEMRKFGVYGTGHNMPQEPGEYVGTFQLHGGSLVFHVFDQIVCKAG